MSPRVPLPSEKTPRGTDASTAKLQTPRLVEAHEPVLGTATRLRSASRAKGPKRRLPSKFETDGHPVDQAQQVINKETIAAESHQSVTSMLDRRAIHNAEQKEHTVAMVFIRVAF